MTVELKTKLSTIILFPTHNTSVKSLRLYNIHRKFHNQKPPFEIRILQYLYLSISNQIIIIDLRHSEIFIVAWTILFPVFHLKSSIQFYIQNIPNGISHSCVCIQILGRCGANKNGKYGEKKVRVQIINAKSVLNYIEKPILSLANRIDKTQPSLNKQLMRQQ